MNKRLVTLGISQDCRSELDSAKSLSFSGDSPQIGITALATKQAAAILAFSCVVFCAGFGRVPAARIVIDYPEDGTNFPPEITPPTFLFRDGSYGASSWTVDISFGDGAPGVRTTTRGEPMRIGPIDRDCVSSINETPSYSEARHKKNTILEHKIQEYLHGSREWDDETRIAGAA